MQAILLWDTARYAVAWAILLRRTHKVAPIKKNNEIGLKSSYTMHPTIPDRNLIFGSWGQGQTTHGPLFKGGGRRFIAIFRLVLLLGPFLDHDLAKARI